MREINLPNIDINEFSNAFVTDPEKSIPEYNISNIDINEFSNAFVDQPSVQGDKQGGDTQVVIGQEDRGYIDMLYASPYTQYGLLIFALIGLVLSVKKLCKIIPFPQRSCSLFYKMKVFVVKLLIWMVLFGYFATHFNVFLAFDLAIILIYGRDLKNLYERVTK